MSVLLAILVSKKWLSVFFSSWVKSTPPGIIRFSSRSSWFFSYCAFWIPLILKLKPSNCPIPSPNSQSPHFSPQKLQPIGLTDEPSSEFRLKLPYRPFLFQIRKPDFHFQLLQCTLSNEKTLSCQSMSFSL